uniref:Uncharacterized protein n=1 Tax=Candidatus Methanogaster sp. ANME-2c ERB4 TaxID=2759911 RepID=A0A7G9YDM3_9EURY|nr:hypothetical protein FAKCHJAF_00044 [Methanosarcinales archaeon ANME-2c ERB4]
MEAVVALDSPIHLRGFCDHAATVLLQLRIDSADVLAADKCNSRYRCSYCDMIPVLPCDLG